MYKEKTKTSKDALTIFFIAMIVRLIFFFFLDPFIDGDSAARSRISVFSFYEGDLYPSTDWLPASFWSLNFFMHLSKGSLVLGPQLFIITLSALTSVMLYLILCELDFPRSVRWLAMALTLSCTNLNLSSISFLTEPFHIFFYLNSVYLILLCLSQTTNVPWVCRFLRWGGLSVAVGMLCLYRIEGQILTVLLSFVVIFIYRRWKLGLLILLSTALAIGFVEYQNYHIIGETFRALKQSDRLVKTFYFGKERLQDMARFFMLFPLPVFGYLLWDFMKRPRDMWNFLKKKQGRFVFIIPIAVLTLLQMYKLLIDQTLVSSLRYFQLLLILVFVIFSDFSLRALIQGRLKRWFFTVMLLVFVAIEIRSLFSDHYHLKFSPGFRESAAYMAAKTDGHIILDHGFSDEQKMWFAYAQHPRSRYLCFLDSHWKDIHEDLAFIKDCILRPEAQYIVLFPEGKIAQDFVRLKQLMLQNGVNPIEEKRFAKFVIIRIERLI
jgi:hypothetical protein